MKIKNDYITNSSSTSFIVAWNREIKSEKDINSQIMTTFSDQIFKDVQDQEAIILKKEDLKFFRAHDLITEEILKGSVDGVDIDDFDYCYNFDKTNLTREQIIQIKHERFKKSEKETIKRAKIKAKKFIEDNMEKVVYVFTYGNETNQSIMEDKRIFGKLSLIVVNKH